MTDSSYRWLAVAAVTDMSIAGIVCTHVFPSTPAESYTVATGTPSTLILTSKYHITAKEPKFFGEMSDSRAETRTFKMSLEYLVVLESTEMLKRKQAKNRKNGGMQRNTGSNLMSFSMTKAGTT